MYPSNDRRPITGDRHPVLYTVLVVAALILVACRLSPMLRHLSWSAPATPASTGPAARPVVSVRGGPFDNTVAVHYAIGKAGIVLPAAKAVDGFSASYVDAGLKKVRGALIAGRLDERMLVRHDTSGFAALLAPFQRTWARDMRLGAVTTWIDPAVKLDPKYPPRVSGTVTYAVVAYEGRRHLQITTNFVWAYGFRTGEPPYAAVHDTTRWEFFEDPLLPRDQWGLFVADMDYYLYAVDCAASENELLSPDQHPRVDTVHDPERPDAYLSPDHPMQVRDGCP
ncbi:hypothetical protein [Paractinoplanes globisporus]|uniref:Uncharacterized protein n=1 Tax=Paractinoplanes globisporus TaxID=113565 RepID=A0ABW6WAN5_9ACTN|nr:hypothetical protein [Actinoplanes globisporus]